MSKINSGKQIFKLNFFVDTDSDDSYYKLREKAQLLVSNLLSAKIVQNFIAQPPLTCKVIIEAFFYDTALWRSKFISNGNNAATLFKRGNTEILVGNVQSNTKQGCEKNTKNAFSELTGFIKIAQFPLNSIVRQWNYLENILGFDGEKQRYQEFNNIRSEVYGNAFEDTGYPAATGIGMNRGGIILEFVAVKSGEVKTAPVDNPKQIAAHNYSKKVLIGEECVLKTTPKFERARYFEMLGKKLIFISGTASIVGEKTVGVENPMEQTKVTINNIQRLYSKDVLGKISNEPLIAKYGHARVYIKRRNDFPSIRKVFTLYFGNLSVVYILADICRNDLLVEIEGKVILE
ncbi:MAG: hypothetical protein L3J11_05215 [Draconibacterium sp.]|nr:hypothetical protein [Draconibacterium sp.]